MSSAHLLRRILTGASLLIAVVASAEDNWPEIFHQTLERQHRYHDPKARDWGDLERNLTEVTSKLGYTVRVADKNARHEDALGHLHQRDLMVFLENVPVSVVVETVADAIGMQVQVNENERTIYLTRRSAEPLTEHRHVVNPKVLSAIPFALRQSQTTHSRVDSRAIEQFLRETGIDLPEGSSVNLDANDGSVRIITTAKGQYDAQTLFARLGSGVEMGETTPQPAAVDSARAKLDAWLVAAPGPQAWNGMLQSLASQRTYEDAARELQNSRYLTVVDSHQLDLSVGRETGTSQRSLMSQPEQRSSLTAGAQRLVALDGQAAMRVDLDWDGQATIGGPTRFSREANPALASFELRTTLDLVPDRPVVAAAVSVPRGANPPSDAGPALFLIVWLHDLTADGGSVVADSSSSADFVRPPAPTASAYAPIHAPRHQNGNDLIAMLHTLGDQLRNNTDLNRPNGYIWLGRVRSSRRGWAGGGSDGEVNGIREGWQLHALLRGRTVVLMDPVVTVEPMQTAIIPLNDADGRSRPHAEYALPGVHTYTMPGIDKMILRGPASILAELDLPAGAIDDAGSAPSIGGAGSRLYAASTARIDRSDLLNRVNRQDPDAIQTLTESLGSRRARDVELLGLHVFAASPAADTPRFVVAMAPATGQITGARRVAAVRILNPQAGTTDAIRYAELVEDVPASLVDGRLEVDLDRPRDRQTLSQAALDAVVAEDAPALVTDYSLNRGGNLKLVLQVEPDATAAALAADAPRRRWGSGGPQGGGQRDDARREGGGGWRATPGGDDRQDNQRPSAITPGTNTPPATDKPDWY